MSYKKNRAIGYLLFLSMLLIDRILSRFFDNNILYYTVLIIAGSAYLIWVILMYARDGTRALKYLDFFFNGLFFLVVAVWNLLNVISEWEIVVTMALPEKIYNGLSYTLLILSVCFLLSRMIHYLYTQSRKRKKQPNK